MEKNNTLPWMLATMFLVGFIIGFGSGKFINMNNQATAENMAANINAMVAAQDKGLGNGDVINTQPAAIETSVENIYGNIEKKFNGKQWSLGSPNAKVKIEEFSDFQCPFCFRYFVGAFPQLVKEYIATGKVYYTFYNYPLEFHPQAQKAAEAAMCAGDQNKYWEMHDLLFANQTNWSSQPSHLETFKKLAQSLSLNMSNYENCMNSNKYAAQVQSDLNAGRQKNVSGTPTFLINGEELVGAQDFSVFAEVIEKSLK